VGIVGVGVVIVFLCSLRGTLHRASMALIVALGIVGIAWKSSMGFGWLHWELQILHGSQASGWMVALGILNIAYK
jgi:hypothetical protein